MEKQKLDQEFLKSHGDAVFQNSKSARTTVEQTWYQSMLDYDSKFSNREKNKSDVLLGQSRLFIPKTYNTVQRILTDVLDAIFFDEDEIVAVKSDSGRPSQESDTVKCLLNYRLNGHPIDFYQEAYESVLDALRNKVGIFKVYPKLRVLPFEKKRNVKNDDGVEVEVIDTEERVVDFEPRLECVPPEDLFLSPEATWKDYWKFPMVHRIAKTRDELKRGGFKNVDFVGQASRGSASEQLKFARDPDTGIFTGTNNVKAQEQVFDYEIWTFLDLEGDGELKSVVYHMLGGANGPEVIGKDPVENTLPYKFSKFEHNRPPFVIGLAFPESHKMYGKDLPEITQSLQKETNILRNQDREAAALAIRKPLLVNRDAGLDMQALVNRKIGGHVMGDDIGNDAVRELQTSNPIVNTAAISARIDQDYFEATSITPNQLGVSTRDETATAVTTNQGNANKKINNVIRNLKNSLFLVSFRYLLRLEQAYESDAFIQMVTGKVLGWKFPNDGIPAWNRIQGEFDLSVEMGLNKQAQLNKYLLIMDRMNQTNGVLMQMMQAGVVNPQTAKFLNPMWAFRKAMYVLKHKDIAEMELEAVPPPPQPSEQKGLASQPRMVEDPSQQTGQFNPEMIDEIL